MLPFESLSEFAWIITKCHLETFMDANSWWWSGNERIVFDLLVAYPADLNIALSTCQGIYYVIPQ